MNKKGFTLVELAIVLVIIGIILGGVLKGQEIISNARIKRVQKDLKSLEAISWSFYDRYGRMPGDCNRDGLIDAPVYNGVGGLDNNPSSGFCGNSYDGDRDRPWAELKAARFLSAEATNQDLSKTLFNGRFFIGRAYPSGSNRYYNAIAIADIPCFAAKAIDMAIDSAINSGAGRIRRLNSSYRFDTSDMWDNVCTTEDTLVDIVYLFDTTP